jgi:hypothetical protein
MLSDHIDVEQSKTLRIRYKGNSNYIVPNDAGQTKCKNLWYQSPA